MSIADTQHAVVPVLAGRRREGFCSCVIMTPQTMQTARQDGESGGTPLLCVWTVAHMLGKTLVQRHLLEPSEHRQHR